LNLVYRLEKESSMKMKRIWTAVVCLNCLILAGASRLFAAGVPSPTDGQELRAKMAAKGWKEISKDVYERQRGPQKFEHLGYGREGLVWMIGELKRELDQLVQEYQKYPSEDLAKAIDHLKVTIAKAERELGNTKRLSNLSEKGIVGESCSICFIATADAFPLTDGSGQGVGAIADAKFSSDCGFSGDSYAFAYARATLNGTTTTVTQEDPDTGPSVESHAEAIVNGASDCASIARAYALSTDLGFSYSTSDDNSVCSLPPPTISGSATASISGTSCQTLTWSATTNGGVSPFTYAWTIDGVAVGTSSSTSVSKDYCGDNTAHSQTANVALTVTDSTGQSASNAFTSTISYAPAPSVTISGPATASISGTSCQTLTWNATTNGGFSPFTYAWTIDGVAAGTSSSTSVSKSYCGDNTAHSQTANVALTVTDSTGQPASKTFTTTITYAAPLSVTISGPAAPSISGTNCKTLTWSATPSGGSSPYIYAWKIDGVAAGSSSSTSVSKSYCGNNTAHSQTVTVTLTITDSTGQSVTKTFPTTITYTVALSVTLSGSATTSISGTNCKTLTWSATVSGGSSPYTYAWKIDGVSAGTSSSTSVSKSYCGNNTAHSQTVNVALTVTDSAGNSGSDTFSTSITYTVAALTVTISGPATASISGTSCQTITWTSAVSGGTSPFSYAWKIDGVAAGTSSSTSKTFCGSNTTQTQTVNVALTVTDSGSQSASANYTTTINYSTVTSGGGCSVVSINGALITQCP
jgi:hypothetical protein